MNLFLQKILDFELNVQVQYFNNWLRNRINQLRFESFKYDSLLVIPTVPFYQDPDNDCPFYSIGYYSDIQEIPFSGPIVDEHITIFRIDITEIDNSRISGKIFAFHNQKIIDSIISIIEDIRDVYKENILFPYAEINKDTHSNDIREICNDIGITISDRDLKILELIQEGKTNHEIARRFSLEDHSISTISWQWRKILGEKVVPKRTKH